jgi:SAM-dependent methyltransferase
MNVSMTEWTFYCPTCDYWSSSLKHVTPDLAQDEFLAKRKTNENPIDYLDQLREHNFKTCLNLIAKHSNIGLDKLLEVGCGTGLFLKEAARFGFNVTGIEAFEEMARRGINQGLPIRIGFFPDCLDDEERFSIIVFNDVFEHLPNPAQMLQICHAHLSAGGVLVLNLPNSRGPFFSLAKLAVKFNFSSPWDRLWQKMFFTPHLHYFSPKSIEQLCVKNGFEPASESVNLRSLMVRGLWSRIKADPTMSLPIGFIVWLATAFISIIIPLFQSDCTVRVFRRV